MKFFTKYIFLLFVFSYVVNASWKKLPDYGGIPTDAAISFVIDGKMYVGGGLKSNYFTCYDPNTNSWESKAKLPGNRAWAMSFAYDGQGYLVGGDLTGSFELTDEIHKYDPQSDKWTYVGKFPGGKRDGGLAFVIGDKAYIGCGFEGQYLAQDMWEYDIPKNTWTKLPDFPVPVIFPNCEVVGDRVFAGLGASQVAISNFYEFDKNTKSWITRTFFPGEKRQAALSFVYDGKLLIGGGTLDYSTNYNDVWEYNPSNDSWAKKDELELPNYQTAWGVSETISDKLYYGMGAELANAGYSDEFFSYNFKKVGQIAVISDLIFNPTYLGESSEAKININNTGEANLVIEDIQFRSNLDNAFELSDLNLPMTIEPNSLESITIKFTPVKLAEYSTELIIKSNSELNKEIKVNISASADIKQPDLVLSVTEIDFGEVENESSKDEKFIMKNDGIADLVVYSIEVESNKSHFQIQELDYPIIISPEEEKEITITFSPQEEGEINTKILINSNDEEKMSEILVRGSGLFSTKSVRYENDLKIFPNPVKSHLLTISLSKSYTGLGELSIYDTFGNLVKEKKEKISDGIITTKLDNLSKGAYILVLNVDKGSYIQKLLID